MATEMGGIATLLDEGVAPRTPLQQRLAVFGRRLGLAVIAICVVVFAVGLLRGEPLLLLFLTAISLAVAAIPEALPAVVTISLALGAGKMARQHALIRRLPAVETLGSVTAICSDKTGTLTQNRMRVVEVWAAPGATRDWSAAAAGEPWRTLFTALALSNDAAPPVAMATSPATRPKSRSAAQGWRPASTRRCSDGQAPRLFELPFDSERKRMTTVHRAAAGAIALHQGRPRERAAGVRDDARRATASSRCRGRQCRTPPSGWRPKDCACWRSPGAACRRRRRRPTRRRSRQSRRSSASSASSIRRGRRRRRPSRSAAPPASRRR